MDVEELSIAGSWLFTPQQWPDPRGVFLEWYKTDVVEKTIGHPFVLRQVNHSVSGRGTLRGVHFAEVPPSQAKYVYVTQGSAVDFVIDLRVGSPTFGKVEAVLLDDQGRRAVYLSEGLGHAVLSLTDDVALNYLCSEPYAPQREHGVHPLDPALGLLNQPVVPPDVEPLLSDKDATAPTLEDALRSGLLPSYDDCLRYDERLRSGQ